MENYLIYILKAAGSLAIFYLIWFLFFRNEKKFQLSRLYLLFSVLISILLPLNKVNIKIPVFKEKTIQQKDKTEYQKNVNIITEKYSIQKNQANKNGSQNFEEDTVWKKHLILVYFLMFGILAIRILIAFFQLNRLILKCETQIINHQKIFFSNKINNSFSIFSFIFISKSIQEKSELEKIITHENIHAAQYHTFDVILIELLSAVMWFNPVVWILRKTMQQVHEYLADEGVLDTGIDKLEYQALLINHAAEDKLLLSSNFNQSLIKKRIIMMKERKLNSASKVKLFVLIPITCFLFFAISVVNGQNSKVASIAPLKMNVLYVGVDNPLNIVVAGYNPEQIEVKIDNGSVTGQNGEYVAHVQNPGKATISLYSEGILLKQFDFRVKTVPDPVAYFCGKKGGSISKIELLGTKEIKVFLENFDFDLHFTITEFTISSMIDGYVTEKISKSNKISEEQYEFIKKIPVGGKVYFENISCIGADGTTIKLAPIVFNVE